MADLKRIVDNITELSENKKKIFNKFLTNLSKSIKGIEKKVDDADTQVKNAVLVTPKDYTIVEKNQAAKNLGIYGINIQGKIAEWDGNIEGLDFVKADTGDTTIDNNSYFYKVKDFSSGQMYMFPKSLTVFNDKSFIISNPVNIGAFGAYRVNNIHLLLGVNKVEITDVVMVYSESDVECKISNYFGSNTVTIHFTPGIWFAPSVRDLYMVDINQIDSTFIPVLTNDKIPVLSKDKLIYANGAKSYANGDMNGNPFVPTASFIGHTYNQSDLEYIIKSLNYDNISLTDIRDNVYDRLWGLNILYVRGNINRGLKFAVCDISVADALMYIYTFEGRVYQETDGNDFEPGTVVYDCDCKKIELSALT